MRKKYYIGNACWIIRRVILVVMHGWFFNCLKDRRMWLLSGRNWWNLWILEDEHHVFLGCFQPECQPSEHVVWQYREMFGWRLSAAANEKRPGWEKPFEKKKERGLTTWQDTRRHVVNWCVIWLPRELSSCTKFQLLAWTTTTSRRKNWKTVGGLSNLSSHVVL